MDTETSAIFVEKLVHEAGNLECLAPEQGSNESSVLLVEGQGTVEVPMSRILNGTVEAGRWPTFDQVQQRTAEQVGVRQSLEKTVGAGRQPHTNECNSEPPSKLWMCVTLRK